MELKIQRKNPGSALRLFEMPPQTGGGKKKATFKHAWANLFYNKIIVIEFFALYSIRLPNC